MQVQEYCGSLFESATYCGNICIPVSRESIPMLSIISTRASVEISLYSENLTHLTLNSFQVVRYLTCHFVRSKDPFHSRGETIHILCNYLLICLQLLLPKIIFRYPEVFNLRNISGRTSFWITLSNLVSPARETSRSRCRREDRMTVDPGQIFFWIS